VRLRRCQPSLRVLFMSGFATDIEQERLDEIGSCCRSRLLPRRLPRRCVKSSMVRDRDEAALDADHDHALTQY
jgi:hypothetical protein